MRIIRNPDDEYEKEVKKMIKDNNGYCPCKLVKTKDTKCKCKDFRDQVEAGVEGSCHCGFWIAVAD